MQAGVSEPVTVRAKSSTLVSKYARGMSHQFVGSLAELVSFDRLINAFATAQRLNPATIRLVSPTGERMRPNQRLADYGVEGLSHFLVARCRIMAHSPYHRQ